MSIKHEGVHLAGCPQIPVGWDERESVCLDENGEQVEFPLVWWNRFRCATPGCAVMTLVEIQPEPITWESILSPRIDGLPPQSVF